MFTETLTLKGPTGCCVLYVVELENSIPMHLVRSGARSSYRWLNNRLWLKINEIENESSLYDSFSVHVFCNKYYEMIKNTLISIHPSILFCSSSLWVYMSVIYLNITMRVLRQPKSYLVVCLKKEDWNVFLVQWLPVRKPVVWSLAPSVCIPKYPWPSYLTLSCPQCIHFTLWDSCFDISKHLLQVSFTYPDRCFCLTFTKLLLFIWM